jgi:hypothetical protein
MSLWWLRIDASFHQNGTRFPKGTRSFFSPALVVEALSHCEIAAWSSQMVHGRKRCCG